jgi:ABC-type transport system substrate-binding protein
MSQNYWSRVVQQRITRRRALASAGAGALGAAFLAACGGGGDENQGPVDRSGLLSPVVDETKDVKRGGTVVGSHPGVILTWDPMLTGINIRGARRGYSQLFRIEDGIGKNADGTLTGDLAQSWEVSPDGLTITAKLDPGAGTPPVPPVNGRVLDSDDVLFSWERLKTSGVLRGDIVHSVNAGAPIESITAPDKSTVVIKLAAPDATALPLLASDRLGTMFIMPKEAADQSKFDVRNTAIGSGPFYVTEASEVSYRWKRNPNFKRVSLKNNEPFVDEVHEPVIPEVATATAQLRAGAIHWYNVPADQVVLTKREVSDLIMYKTVPIITGTERIYFGHLPESPFKDDRVRRAYMMTIDRDLFIEAALNTDQFEREGLPVEKHWESGLGVGSYSGWYLDPRSKEFGPNAKWHEFDVAEAKKLVEAAGHSTPLKFDQVFAAPGDRSFPAGFYRRSEIYMGMVAQSGVFEANNVLVDYQLEWNTERYRWSKGQFNGATWGPDTASPDGASATFFLFNSAGGYFQGGDAHMDDLTVKARREFDTKKRMDLVHEIQRYNGEKMFNNKIGHAGGFALRWPALRNYGVFIGGTNWMDLRVFIDPEKPPLKRS